MALPGIEQTGQITSEPPAVLFPRQKTITLPCDYQYLRLRIEIAETGKTLFGPEAVTELLQQALERTYGRLGGNSLPFTLLQFERQTGMAILRCSARHAMQIRSSLALVNEHNGLPCRVEVLLFSPFLLSIARDSREKFWATLPHV
eukprot:TRINITY_DN7065_c0_g2_i1.p1 TRINITY_DN7065_c0_g2~~TRINITY_DN7065_c0_g2_i1.p1  ORF type:complete len:146 (+),score=0.59 TRINITY_DN7065_c0_g2_i1:77-514(+)